jgi:hypothetical protein
MDEGIEALPEMGMVEDELDMEDEEGLESDEDEEAEEEYWRLMYGGRPGRQRNTNV